MAASFGDVYNPPTSGCGASSRPHPLPSSSDPLDWECPNKMCRNVNFKKRPKCNICGTPKPSNARQDPRYERAKAEAASTREGDRDTSLEWFCTSCQALNVGNAERCRECQVIRPERRAMRLVERAGGKAGGFFDRSDANDRRNWDSDTEDVDEFGRKKKATPESKRERQQAALQRLYRRTAARRGAPSGSPAPDRSRSRGRR
mmetsp:Transcript_58334/g.164711  ORF Transcript_58334/g.164711 Transcript_58334/m.164711 type:complete len:203 (+) Transcript_58334:136-744(+)